MGREGPSHHLLCLVRTWVVPFTRSPDRTPFPVLFARLSIGTLFLCVQKNLRQGYYFLHLTNMLNKAHLVPWGVSVVVAEYQRLVSL